MFTFTNYNAEHKVSVPSGFKTSREYFVKHKKAIKTASKSFKSLLLNLTS
jgi:hypothetical protein